MAAKLLHSLADDNPDLQKQIGCMSGIFQIFDRQHIGRRLNGHSHKRLLPPGNAQFSNASLDADSNDAYNQDTMENKHTNDKRVPTESSSSCSSSFSSHDCGRAGLPDPYSLDRTASPETPSRDPVLTQPISSPKLGRLSLDLRDVVKDSMYRESRGLSNQTIMKEEGLGKFSKHRDSPCPFQLLKTPDGSLGIEMNGKNDLPSDLRESLKLLAKLQEAPWYYGEKEHARLSYGTKDSAKDAPRYSYDGREINYLSSESRDLSKSNQRIKDLPRLSLDSRESSIKKFNDIRDDGFHERVSYARPPSVVAKLMGLDALPDNKTVSLERHVRCSLSSKTSEICRPIRLPSSPRSSRKEPTSPRWKHGDMRPISSSKCPIEPAPWKHFEGDRSSQKQVLKQLKSPEKSSKSSPSVYCEIEKRLNDLEFKQSGKDLRALKQILETMQAKGLLGAAKEEQNSILGAKQEEAQACKSSKANSGFISASESHRNRAGTSIVRGASASKAYESSIVIMKPAKLVQQSGIPASSLIPIGGLSGLRSQDSDIAGHGKYSVNQRTAKNQTSRDNGARTSNDRIGSNKTLRMGQNSTRAQQVSKDSSVSSSKNSGSTSPRLQKKLELDKRSRPPTPDSGKSRKQSNWQSTECGGSAGGRRRVKSGIVLKTDDQLTAKSSEFMNLSGLVENISVGSEAVTLESKVTAEITGNESSVETSECQIPNTAALKYSDISEIKTNSSTRSSEDDQVDELPTIAPEHPSPVSVLDASAYREDSPSPVKQTSQYLDGIGIRALEDDPGEGEWKLVNNFSANHDVGSDFISEINSKKLRNIENLVHKLKQLNPDHDEVRTDYVAFLCENSNPDHRYVSEILLASGLLLRDLGSGLPTFQLHLSGHPINPELFLVLEQTKLSSLLCKAECNTDNEATKLKLMQEKFHRKLIFDVVNEILARKLASLGPADPWLKPCKLAGKTLNAQKLLKELCAEVEELQGRKRKEFSLEEEDELKSILWEDVMHRSDGWTDFHSDVSGVVLDVERSIFKDLIDEIVIREAAGLRGKPRTQRRLLFLK